MPRIWVTVEVKIHYPPPWFNENRNKIKKLLSNFYVKVDLIKDKLDFKSTYNLSNATIETRNLNFTYFVGNNFQRENSAITKRYSEFVDQIWDNVLTLQPLY